MLIKIKLLDYKLITKNKFFYLHMTYLVIFFHYYMDYESNINFKSLKIDYASIKTYILNMNQAFF